MRAYKLRDDQCRPPPGSRHESASPKRRCDAPPLVPGSRWWLAHSGTIAPMRVERIGEWGEAHLREPARRTRCRVSSLRSATPFPTNFESC
jgi:hypothetical protein